MGNIIEIKKCRVCDKEKLVDDFDWKIKNVRKRNICKQCWKIYRRKHYVDNKQYYVVKVRKYKRKTREWLNKFKKKLSCSCGENHISCLDFHHRDRTKKEISIATAVNKGWSPKRIKKELEKCDVLCANCHRKLHWRE